MMQLTARVSWIVESHRKITCACLTCLPDDGQGPFLKDETVLLDPTGHVVWADEIAHLKQHEREGAPHTHDVTFLLTAHVNSSSYNSRVRGVPSG